MMHEANFQLHEDEVAPMRRDKMKRRMEAPEIGGELRKINVVYFLCNNREVEQPHLIRIHHFHRNGIRLRDVKRWLSELRGKDMPNSFSWSYKRRYKGGFVWQDLTDNELITPISDNEFVVKGSLLFQRDDRLPLDSPSEPNETLSPKSPAKSPPKFEQETPLLIGNESPGTPPPPTSHYASDESSKRGAILTSDFSTQQQEEQEELMRMIEELEKHQQKSQPKLDLRQGDEQSRRRRSTPAEKKSSQPSCQAASRVLKSLMHCGNVDTRDSAVRPVNRPVMDRQVSLDVSSRRRRSFGGGSTPRRTQRQNSSNGHTRKSWSTSEGEGRRSTRKAGEKPVPAIYRPSTEPNCSQCGRTFKPEKLHAHMISCKGMREKRRKSRSMEKTQKRSELQREEFSMEKMQKRSELQREEFSMEFSEETPPASYIFG